MSLTHWQVPTGLLHVSFTVKHQILFSFFNFVPNRCGSKCPARNISVSNVVITASGKRLVRCMYVNTWREQMDQSCESF